MAAYQVGNTVQLQATFKNFAGILVDPEIIKVKFYDANYIQLAEVTLVPDNKISTGVYEYYLVVPSTKNPIIYYEWYAEIDSMPSLKRQKLENPFI